MTDVATVESIEPSVEPGSRPSESRFWIGALGLFVVAWIGASLLTVFGLAIVGRWQPSVVMTGSMAPGLDVGDVMLSRQNPDPTAIGLGSVVTFPDPIDPARTITHRVVAIDAESGLLQTKGDANEAPDSAWLSPDDVIAEGKAMVPYIGLPAVWYHAGAWAKFLGFIIVLAGALWASRWVWLNRFDPWGEPSPVPGAG